MTKKCSRICWGVISGVQLPVLLGNGEHLAAFDVKDWKVVVSSIDLGKRCGVSLYWLHRSTAPQSPCGSRGAVIVVAT